MIYVLHSSLLRIVRMSSRKGHRREASQYHRPLSRRRCTHAILGIISVFLHSCPSFTFHALRVSSTSKRLRSRKPASSPLYFIELLHTRYLLLNTNTNTSTNSQHLPQLKINSFTLLSQHGYQTRRSLVLGGKSRVG